MEDSPPSTSSTSTTDQQQQPLNKNNNNLDPTLIEAINNGTIRDKQILLAAETEMGRFLSTDLQRQPLSSSLSNSLNSYQRMLVHRLGDSFGIKRTLESGQMYLERTPTSASPTVRLETLIARQNPTTPSNSDLNLAPPNNPSVISSSNPTTPISDPTLTTSPTSSPSPSLPNPNLPAPTKTFKIMSRTLSQSSRQTNRNLMPSTASSGSSNDCSLSESKRNEMSYEERQAAYLEARNRIFAANSASSHSVENSTGESTAGSTSSSSGGAGPEEDRLSVATSTSKKSKSPSDLLSPVDQPTTPESKLPSCATQKNQKTESSRSTNPKLAVKLRPSATSFDPTAKAHGYEEVTIIELDDHSITVPCQDPHLIYHQQNSSYTNGFAPRDSRLLAPLLGPAGHNNGFNKPGPYPINPRHSGPSSSSNQTVAHIGPFYNHHPTAGTTNSGHKTTMPTMIGTVPLAPITSHHHPHPHPGATNPHNRPPFLPDNARPAHELAYTVDPPSFLPFLPHPPPHPQSTGPSNGFLPAPFNRPPPPPPHQQQQHQAFDPSRLTHPPSDPNLSGWSPAPPIHLPPPPHQLLHNSLDTNNIIHHHHHQNGNHHPRTRNHHHQNNNNSINPGFAHLPRHPTLDPSSSSSSEAPSNRPIDSVSPTPSATGPGTPAHDQLIGSFNHFHLPPSHLSLPSSSSPSSLPSVNSNGSITIGSGSVGSGSVGTGSVGAARAKELSGSGQVHQQTRNQNQLHQNTKNQSLLHQHQNPHQIHNQKNLQKNQITQIHRTQRAVVGLHPLPLKPASAPFGLPHAHTSHIPPQHQDSRPHPHQEPVPDPGTTQAALDPLSSQKNHALITPALDPSTLSSSPSASGVDSHLALLRPDLVPSSPPPSSKRLVAQNRPPDRRAIGPRSSPQNSSLQAPLIVQASSQPPPPITTTTTTSSSS
ncbi:hypothetical protein PGT21_014197 [Puccinia graminis f. sp. tritici]|uniref:SUZ domain-containing protein n=1 Tax=Puccinia graminis f. sp. tritici TaxID=56615 RepID=A0A5B0QFA2_PUCGR|nr:hypothetical protein PGT21_014197 [Puccinia graminis f. sp. tritici]